MEDTFTIPRFGDERLALQVGRYANGNTAVQLVAADGEEPYATLSVNVPGVLLRDGDFVFKNYAENAGLLPELLAASRVEVTGGMVRVGMAGIQLVCRIPEAD